MALRNYNNTTVAGALTAPASPSDVFMSVTEFAGYPAPPFTATVERSLPTEEVVLVTAVNADTLTVTRGYNGTAAQTHLAGAPIEHTAVALDFSEANSHVNATDNVHGIVGGLVGDEAPQTLLDKTLISPVVEADVAAGDAIVAYVPEGAEARNLFRGMSPAGDDVFTVDSSGQAIAARLHSTGNSETDGDSQVDGNQTVGGNLTVTGTSAFTGAVTVPVQAAAASPARKEYVDALGTATSTANTVVRRDGNGNTAIDAITLTDAPTVAGHAARKDYVDGQITVFGRHRGNGTAYPGSPIEGDTFRRTDLGYTARYDGTQWIPIDPIFGKMWRTAGFSSAFSALTVVVMNASRLSGGFTADLGSSTLTVPLDGHYRLIGRGYASGGGGGNDVVTYLRRIRAGIADLSILTHVGYKATSNDLNQFVTDVQPLKAGDKLYLAMAASTGTTTYYGAAENAGAALLAEYVGPLNGATPL